MDAQRLSYFLDTLIADLLAQRKQRLETHTQVMRVVLSGDDLTTLPATLECLTALERSGYLLVMVFSHSARESSLQSRCLQALAQRGIEVICDNQEPQPGHDTGGSLYFPALSTNSLSKIALGIRDNLVCRWAFHALSTNKAAIVTLNPECQPNADNPLPQAFRTRLVNYANTLAEYGFTVIGLPRTDVRRPLISLSDVRQHPPGQPLHVGNRTLITPAARDEIRDRGLVIIQHPQEDTCIWQR